MSWSPFPSAVTVSVVQPEYSVGEGDGTVSVCVTKTGEANFGITGHLVSAGQERAQAEGMVVIKQLSVA